LDKKVLVVLIRTRFGVDQINMGKRQLCVKGL